MVSLSDNATIADYQKFINDVYGEPNDRHFSLWDMMTNIERFTMRGLKGIRQGNVEKTKINLLIALSWFMSTMNRLHINVEDEVWNRFPYICSYCASSPCSCKKEKITSRKEIVVDHSKRPTTIKEFQLMFNNIYPASQRTTEHAGVHLAEEVGELAEAILTYQGMHNDKDFRNIAIESADFISCVIGVFNSINTNLAYELAKRFENNCHVCKKAPCECSFSTIVEFKS